MNRNGRRQLHHVVARVVPPIVRGLLPIHDGAVRVPALGKTDHRPVRDDELLRPERRRLLRAAAGAVARLVRPGLAPVGRERDQEDPQLGRHVGAEADDGVLEQGRGRGHDDRGIVQLYASVAAAQAELGA